MNVDTPEKAMKEAEEWLISAKDKLIFAEDEEGAANVCCSLAIHAVIRANDALTLKFLNTKTTRHDDAPLLFVKMIKGKHISDADIRFKELLASVVRDKSGADYGKQEFSYEEAKEYVEKAEEFVSVIKGYI